MSSALPLTPPYPSSFPQLVDRSDVPIHRPTDCTLLLSRLLLALLLSAFKATTSALFPNNIQSSDRKKPNFRSDSLSLRSKIFLLFTNNHKRGSVSLMANASLAPLNRTCSPQYKWTTFAFQLSANTTRSEKSKYDQLIKKCFCAF